MLNVVFHAFNLGYRGGTNSLRDYAIYNEEILGNRSVIMYHTQGAQVSEVSATELLQKKFEVIPITRFNPIFEPNESTAEVNSMIQRYDVVYSQRSGYDEAPRIFSRPFMLHGVFYNYTDQCTRFAYISRYLSEAMGRNTGSKIPYIPYIVNLPSPNGSLRKQLGISNDQFVFGRIGGYQEFDIEFVHRAIEKILSRRNDIVFLMVNTKPFINHKNVIYIDPFFDEQQKSNFINSCDAMIHAREMGETFGLAMMEFLFFNKPVLAWEKGNDLNHVEVLREFNLLYNEENIESKIEELMVRENFDFSDLMKEFTPLSVMKKFKEVFLDEIK